MNYKPLNSNVAGCSALLKREGGVTVKVEVLEEGEAPRGEAVGYYVRTPEGKIEFVFDYELIWRAS